MLFLGSLLIDTALLGILLLVVAKVDFLTDFMKPFSIILLITTASIVASLVLNGALWGIPKFVIVAAALYYLIGWYFDLPRKDHRIIVGVFLGAKILFSVIVSLV